MLREKGDDDACGGLADGWDVRACAAALTVGLIFWLYLSLIQSLVLQAEELFLLLNLVA